MNTEFGYTSGMNKNEKSPLNIMAPAPKNKRYHKEEREWNTGIHLQPAPIADVDAIFFLSPWTES